MTQKNLKNYVSSRNIPAGVYSLSKHWLVFSRRLPYYSYYMKRRYSLFTLFKLKDKIIR